MSSLLNRLRHHVTGAIERGEATAIVEIPAKPRIISSTMEIAECGNRWLNRTTGRYYKTACHALSAIRRRDKARAVCGVVAVTTVHWYPQTPAGHFVVAALS